jgi:hypothetical protein
VWQARRIVSQERIREREEEEGMMVVTVQERSWENADAAPAADAID